MENIKSLIKLTKIVIECEKAHFKIPMGSKVQRTYSIPPISTNIGIMQNLFNKDIDNFTCGFTFSANEEIFKDIQNIYKEVNLNVYTPAKRYDNNKWTSDICEIHYLINPRLVIYTDLPKDQIKINDCLVLGKTDCLAKVISIKTVKLINKIGYGYNQWTDLNVGQGTINRIATETKYNGEKGIYDIWTKLLRQNEEFEYDKYYDEEEEQNICLWKYNKESEDKIYAL